MKKKYVLFAMLCCLSLMVFVGCGNKTNDNKDSAASPSVEETTNSPDPTGSDALDDMKDGVDDVMDGAKDAVDDATGNGGTTKK